MGKSRAQLYAKLQAFKDELSICESISDLLDTKGFKLAVKEYNAKFKDAIDAENKKEISSYKKTLDLIIDFQTFLSSQRRRAEEIPELINEIEFDLQQGNFFE